MEHTDKRLKYLDLNKAFHNQTTDIRLALKQSNRVCEMLANHLAKEKPKTSLEMDRNGHLKDYVIKTSELNDKVLGLIDYIHGLLTNIGEDSKVLIEGAIIRDRLQFQSDSIEQLINSRDNAIKDVYDLRKNQINTK